jgi:uncharacterized protein DUF3768
VRQPECVKAEALVQVAKFSEFSADNDPHDEHDFGSLDVVGRKFFWKIDYYDKDLCSGGSSKETVRVGRSKSVDLNMSSNLPSADLVTPNVSKLIWRTQLVLRTVRDLEATYHRHSLHAGLLQPPSD